MPIKPEWLSIAITTPRRRLHLTPQLSHSCSHPTKKRTNPGESKDARPSQNPGCQNPHHLSAHALPAARLPPSEPRAEKYNYPFGAFGSGCWTKGQF